HEFSELFLLVQGVAVLILAPLYFGGAISEEKERGTLDFLLTSHLSSREIILGKFAARLLGVAGVLLTGLPVLALTALWGGVDLLRVATAFVVALLTLFSLGAVSLLFSVLSPRTIPAIAASLGVAAGMLTCCGPMGAGITIGALSHLRSLAASQVMVDPPKDMGIFILIHGLIALVALVLAALQLRLRAAPFAPPAALPIAPDAARE